MSGYNKLNSDLEVKAGLVREFSTRIRKLKEISSKSSVRLSEHEIQQEYEQAFKLSKDLTVLFRKSNANRNEKFQSDKLFKEYENLLKEFNSLGSAILNKKKEVIDQEPIVKEEDPEMNKIKVIADLTNPALLERKEEIEGLEKDIIEVNSMYKEVSELIEEQGVVLEEAERNADISVKETGKAVAELKKGSEHQEAAKQKLMVICVLIVIIVVLIILVVLGYLYI